MPLDCRTYALGYAAVRRRMSAELRELADRLEAEATELRGEIAAFRSELHRRVIEAAADTELGTIIG